MKKIIWREDRRYVMSVTCFLPEQLINMADGTLKPIGDVVLGDEIQVFKLNEEELYHPNSVVWEDTNRIHASLNSKQIGQLETSIVNTINRKLHDDVCELHLENGKVLKPTGNHPFFTDKGWTTIDGHNPNHAGGSGHLKVGDKVFDSINNTWVSVIDIVRVEGEYETFNLIDTDTNTIIADNILTHNSSIVISGTEDGLEHSLWSSGDDGHEKINVTEVAVGDTILGFDLESENLVDTKVKHIDKTTSYAYPGHGDDLSGKATLKIDAGENSILFTISHIIPYYRDDVLIEDNMGTLEVGDEVIVCDVTEHTSSRVTVDTITEKVTEPGSETIHPYTDKGYYFVNNILVEG